MRSLECLEQVTVAALQGIVCGAGMALAQACDFRIMTEDSTYVVPETNIGTRGLSAQPGQQSRVERLLNGGNT